MFLPIEGGSVINIQGLDCWIPPEGYVVDIKTKKLRYIGVYSRSENIEEQYWERIKPPKWYAQVLKEEDLFNKKKKDDSEQYFNQDYEDYKQQEWDRRLNGFWFKNHGVSVYLVGPHYLFLEHTQIDIGYPEYRRPDLEYYYFQQYVIEDFDCLGMLELTKRRFGKTYRGGVFVLDYPTRTKMTNGTIQSKTGADAKKVFAKAVVDPFKKWPRFFKPEYDLTGGVTPKSELRFQNTNVRGKKAEENLEKEELGSLIDYYSADALATDGQKIHRKLDDEWAKTIECDIYQRHEVTRYCLMDDEGRIIGKVLYTSTVEVLETEKEGVQDAAKKLWNDSDQLKKGENGRTASGLYRFFMTADRAKNFDKYGEPNVEKTIAEILADRETVKHNLRSLAARIRKEARTIEEAFNNNDDDCIFNRQNINKQRAYLRENPITHWRYLHYYRDLDQVVRWRDVDPDQTTLYWKQLAIPKPSEANQFVTIDGMRKPLRTGIGVIGIDGYSNTQGGKKYGSKLSGWMFIKYDLRDPHNTGLFTGHIYGRPNEKDDMYNQILLAAEYNGFAIYFEFVADDYYTYFKNRGRIGYLGRFPRNSIDPIKFKKEKVERHFGFPTTEFALTKQNDAMITYVEHYCDKIYYDELLEDLPKFKPYKRTEYDRTVSAMITLVSSLEVQLTPPPMRIPLVTVYENENYGKEVIEEF